MLSKEEIENSIEYKYNKFYESDTYQLTTEEAKYILLEDKGFRDTVNFAAAKTLLNKIEQLETNNKNLIEKLEEDKIKWQEFHNRVPEVPEYIDYILPFAKGEKE